VASLLGVLAACGGGAEDDASAPLHDDSAAISVLDGKITRSEAIRRVHHWLDIKPPYNDGSSGDVPTTAPDPDGRPYRPDCSGSVSMAWHLSQSYTTWQFNPSQSQFVRITHVIARSALLPGDALVIDDASGDHHIALFDHWADAAHTQPVVDEEYDFGRTEEQRTWSASKASAYTPIRYNGIVDDPVKSYGTASPGLARSADGHLTFYLTNDMNGSAATDFVVHYGNTGDTAVTGDWNGDGHASPGLVRTEDGHLTWYLTNDMNGKAVTDYVVHYGNAGDIPVVGDWNGDGRASPGLVRNEGGHLTWYFTNDVTGKAATDFVIHYGNAGDIPVVGDWNLDGHASPGIVREGLDKNYTWYLTNAMTGKAVTDFVIHYGYHGDIPVTGDWNADGRTNIGLLREADKNYTWYLTKGLTGKAATDYVIHYGYHGDQPITSNWN